MQAVPLRQDGAGAAPPVWGSLRRFTGDHEEGASEQDVGHLPPQDTEELQYRGARTKGWTDVPYHVQATLRTQREDTAEGPVFYAEVKASRQNPNLMGKNLYAGATTDPRGIPGGLNMQMLLGLVQST